MNLNSITNIVSSILTIALVTVVLGSPNTAKVIRQAGATFTGALRTAMGAQAG